MSIFLSALDDQMNEYLMGLSNTLRVVATTDVHRTAAAAVCKPEQDADRHMWKRRQITTRYGSPLRNRSYRLISSTMHTINAVHGRNYTTR